MSKYSLRQFKHTFLSSCQIVKKRKTIERNREPHLGQRRLRRNECIAEKEGPGIEEEKRKKKRKSKDRQSCKLCETRVGPWIDSHCKHQRCK